MNLSIFIILFFIAVLVTMVGRVGGNFYVLFLVMTGISVHQSATIAQFIMALSGFTALIVFHRNRHIDWKLALLIDPPPDIMAFVGGYYSHVFSGYSLKFVITGVLILSAFFMAIPVREHVIPDIKKPGFWHRRYNGYEYTVNLWLTIPITALAGFIAGTIGIAGGLFKIPLMVMACGVPMRIAVGTSSAMVALTAFMGFTGHLLKGDFNSEFAVPLAILAVLGGLAGGLISIKTRSKNLKKLFIYLNIAGAVLILYNMFTSG
jgi:uncharacterized membrane protein YfcA